MCWHTCCAGDTTPDLQGHLNHAADVAVLLAEHANPGTRLRLRSTA